MDSGYRETRVASSHSARLPLTKNPRRFPATRSSADGKTIVTGYDR
ncbi:MAG TPA: hypothetical protein VJ161_02320 [Geobacteraceae bacterium]|nr:hypothetical protein [Geobacteraceae bacterium]